MLYPMPYIHTRLIANVDGKSKAMSRPLGEGNRSSLELGFLGRDARWQNGDAQERVVRAHQVGLGPAGRKAGQADCQEPLGVDGTVQD